MENDDFNPLGCLAGPAIFCVYAGFCVFMFWLCMKIFGWNL